VLAVGGLALHISTEDVPVEPSDPPTSSEPRADRDVDQTAAVSGDGNVAEGTVSDTHGENAAEKEDAQRPSNQHTPSKRPKTCKKRNMPPKPGRAAKTKLDTVRLIQCRKQPTSFLRIFRR